MRWHVAFAADVFAALFVVLTPAEAQQPYWQNANPRARAGAVSRDDADFVRPYGSSRRGADRGRSFSQSSMSRPIEGVRSSPAPRRNYFPGQRSGQSLNSNMAPTRHICVPSRHSMLTR
jgi:hypothetical protein